MRYLLGDVEKSFCCGRLRDGYGRNFELSGIHLGGGAPIPPIHSKTELSLSGHNHVHMGHEFPKSPQSTQAMNSRILQHRWPCDSIRTQLCASGRESVKGFDRDVQVLGSGA